MNATREQGFSTQMPVSVGSGGMDKADHVAASAGETLEAVAGTLREKAPEDGRLGGVATAVADYMDTAGSYLQEEGISGALDDIEALIRRYPVQSLLLGLGAGYLLARMKAR